LLLFQDEAAEVLPSPQPLVQTEQAGQDLDEDLDEEARFLIGRDPKFIGFSE